MAGQPHPTFALIIEAAGSPSAIFNNPMLKLQPGAAASWGMSSRCLDVALNLAVKDKAICVDPMLSTAS